MKNSDFMSILTVLPLIITLFVGCIVEFNIRSRRNKDKSNRKEKDILLEYPNEMSKVLVDRQKEALNTLTDWSKWLIGLQSAFIGLIGLKLNIDGLTSLGDSSIIKGTLISFTISVVAATILIGAIPDALSYRPNSLIYSFKDKKEAIIEVTNISQYKTIIPLISLGSVAAIEHILFLTGIVYLLFGIIF